MNRLSTFMVTVGLFYFLSSIARADISEDTFGCATPVASCPDIDALLKEREGFGRLAKGGLDGSFQIVTSSADDGGKTTLRYIVENAQSAVWIRFAKGIETIDLNKPIMVPSNVTIDGRGRNVKITRGGLVLNGSSNVIVTHLTFDGLKSSGSALTGVDAVSIVNKAQNVWVHHLSLSNYDDGLLDITNGATDVTASYISFTNHSKVMILNTYDDYGNIFVNYERDRLGKITLHNSVFDGTLQRHPQINFGKLHAYNNVLLNYGYYGMYFAHQAEGLLENNYFESNSSSGDQTVGNCNSYAMGEENYNRSKDVYGYTQECKSKIKMTGNVYMGKSIAQPAEYKTSEVFSPGYCYTLQTAGASLKTRLLSAAGNTNALHPVAQRCPYAAPVSVTGFGLSSQSTDRGLSFDVNEKAETSTHQANVYSSTVPLTNQLVLSFDARLSSGRSLLFYALNADNQASYVKFLAGADGKISTTVTGSSRFFELRSTALQDGFIRYEFAIRLKAQRLRFNFRSQFNGDSYAGDPSARLVVRNFKVEDDLRVKWPLLDRWTDRPGLVTAVPQGNGMIIDEVPGNFGSHSVSNYFYADLNRAIGAVVDFSSTKRSLKITLVNAQKQSVGINAVCDPSKPDFSIVQTGLSIRMSTNLNGTRRCRIEGIIDPNGGNKVRLLIHMIDVKNSDTYMGEAGSSFDVPNVRAYLR